MKKVKLRGVFLCFFLIFMFNALKAENTATIRNEKSKNDETAFLQVNEITVKGIVKDAKGEPLVGVTVSVGKSRSLGTITDLNGNFSLKVPVGSVIEFSYIGYKNQKIVVNKRTLDVVLEEDVTSLEDVVIVGYGVQKKESVTGSLSSITTKDLLQSPQANVSNALAGRLPGLFAVQNSGEPGKDASTIRIRGIGTFAGTQDPLVMVDGIESDNYNNIDPNEIESLSILKDASATAVYGVRGANGVILITTKRGQTGKPQLSLSTNAGVSNFPFLRSNMNSYEYATAYDMAQAYDSYVTGNYGQKYTAAQIEKYRTNSDPIFYPNVNWYDYLLKKQAYQTQTNLNIRGGTNRVKYFVSLGYLTQGGMINTDVIKTSYDANMMYKRYNLRSNFDIDLSKNLSLSLDLSSQIGDLRGPNWGTQSFMEMLSSVPPNVAPGIIGGKVVTIQSVTNSTWTPLGVLNKGWHHDYENNLDGSIRLNYKMDYLLKGLSLRGALSYKNYNTESKTFYINSALTYEARPSTTGGVIYIPSGDPSPMTYGSSTNRDRRVYLEYGVNYAHSFGRNNVTGLILYNQSKYYSPLLAFLVPEGYQGIVGRVTYNYDNRYLAEFNIGYNGTENFAKGRRFGTFPAYSLGWVASDEAFFPKKQKAFTFAKIRGSYGEVGNDKIGGDRFLYQPTAYTYQNNVYYFGEMSNSNGWMGSSEGKLGNPFLTWEKAKKLDIGGEFRFLSDRLGLNVDYFVENRDNILYNRQTIPIVSGANFPAYNLGKMRNTGFEGEITYNDKIGGLDYYVKANYSYAHNKILYMDEVSQTYPYIYQTGQRYGQFFGFVAEGIYNTWKEVNDPNRPVYMWDNNRIQPGDIKYKDINGDGKIDQNDMVPIGYSSMPEIMFGFTIGGSYKGFDISLLFQGATNVSNYPSRRTQRGFYTDTGANKDLLKSWSEDRYTKGLEIKYPRYSITNDSHNYVTSTFWLENASYIRLKNAEIGYTFQPVFLKRMGIRSLRVYLNGSNLLTYSKLKFPGEDPEYPTGQANSEPYPATRIYNLGLNINF